MIPHAPRGSRAAGAALVLVAVAGIGVYIGTTVLADGAGRAGRGAYWVAVAGGCAVLAAGWALALRTDRRAALLVVLAGGLVFRLALVPTVPLLSDDLYRYLWDGRVVAAGVSPYRHAPTAPELEHLRDAQVWPLINRPSERTIYPPVAQGVFMVAHRAGLRTPTAWKLSTALVDAAACAVLAAALARLGRDPRGVVAYAWNPLPVLAFGHSGHLEAFVVLAVVAATLAWARGWTRRAGLLLGLAGGLKLYPLLVVPAFLRDRTGRWSTGQALAVSGLAGGVVLAAYLPLVAAGEQVLGFLTEGYLVEEGYASGGRIRLLRAVGVDGRWLVPLVLGAVVAAAVRARQHTAPARATWLLGAALLLTLPYPWYATPLLALAVAGGAAGGWAWFAAGFAASYVQPFFKVGGIDADLSARIGVALLVLGLLMAGLRSRAARRAVLGSPL